MLGDHPMEDDVERIVGKGQVLADAHDRFVDLAILQDARVGIDSDHAPHVAAKPIRVEVTAAGADLEQLRPWLDVCPQDSLKRQRRVAAEEPLPKPAHAGFDRTPKLKVAGYHW